MTFIDPADLHQEGSEFYWFKALTVLDTFIKEIHDEISRNFRKILYFIEQSGF